MEVCVFGVGAVGGYLAARLIASGAARVSLIARGAQLDAIRASGLALIENDARIVVVPAAVTSAPEDLPSQDIVFVTVKAHAQAGVADQVARLLKPGGVAVFIANGVPWWMGAGLETPLPEFASDATRVSELLGDRSLGCIVYSNNEIVRPGVVHHYAYNRWLVGEFDGTHSDRLGRVCTLMRAAGLEVQASSDLRTEVWAKLARNIADGPICALTRLDPMQAASVESLQKLRSRLLEELLATAHAWGWKFEMPAPRRPDDDVAGKHPLVRPSMLQDVLLGRQIEVEPLIDRVRLLAEAQDIPTPTLDAVSWLLHGLNAARTA